MARAGAALTNSIDWYMQRDPRPRMTLNGPVLVVDLCITASAVCTLTFEK